MVLFLFGFELYKPLGDFVHDGSIERIKNILPLFFGFYQARLLQQVQVVGDAGFGNAKMIGNFTGGFIAFLQQGQYLPARAIVQGFEEQVHHLSLVVGTMQLAVRVFYLKIMYTVGCLGPVFTV